jgi:hypothetical protein
MGLIIGSDTIIKGGAGSHTASEIAYDNAASDLAAHNVQAAIDEVLSMIKSTVGNVLTDINEVPPTNKGALGDICITPYGIYQKRMSTVGSGYTLTGANMPNYNGKWIDQGVNTQGTNGGSSNGARWWLHESGELILTWSSAYSGYWWINRASSPKDDNGQSLSYRSDTTVPTNQTIPPPSSNWSGQLNSGTWAYFSGTTTPMQIWERVFGFNATADKKLFFDNIEIAKKADIPNLTIGTF